VSEEAARQAVAVEERARREAGEEAARQIAAAEEQFRREVFEEAARQALVVEERARREAAEENAHQIAAAAQKERSPAEAPVVQLAASEEAIAVKPGEQVRPKGANEVDQDLEADGSPLPETYEEAPREGAAAAGEQPVNGSAEGLPLLKWVHAAAQPANPRAAADWPHELLRKRDEPETDHG